jgi:hypothetical protein
MDHRFHNHQFHSQVCFCAAPLPFAVRDAYVPVRGCLVCSSAFELNWAALSLSISPDFRERTLLFGMVLLSLCTPSLATTL